MEGNREISDGTLRIRLSGEGSRQMLAVSGELDLANAATLEAELRRAAEDGEEIVLDLRGLEFIDSTGIAVLVATHRRLNDGVSRVRLVHSDSPAVRRVIQITGLESELPFVDGGAPASNSQAQL